jgi:V8-like Glu-specific endopeptidase
MQRAGAVAQVETRMGDAVGTAFVVRGGDLKPELGDELLLLTNAHVITTDRQVSRALHPDQAVLKFELWQDGASPEFQVDALWSSAPEHLDATLLRPKRNIGNVLPVPIARTLPLADGTQRAYIIGHPQGRKLSFSIHDNHLLDYDDRLLHYRSPTEPGNSGSPVFNAEWRLIGLHHRGLRNMPKLKGKEGTYPANEGIWIQAIIQALENAQLR